MSINKAKVSIILGVYNCEKTISECIESILNQSYKNWELIICDDCSTDNTYYILREYQKLYKDKIILIRNDKNLTLGPTLNKCIKFASGEYIARQDGDDKSELDRVEKQVRFLEENSHIDLVGSNFKLFDSNGVYGIRKMKERPIVEDLMLGVTFAHSTIMTRSEVYKAINGYSESKNAIGAEDYELWFRFFKEGFKGYNLQEPLYLVREDKNAYKRKNISRRINSIKIINNGAKLVGLKDFYKLYIIKSFMAIIIPNYILRLYHRYKCRQ